MIDNESTNHPRKDREDKDCPVENECSRQKESRHRDALQEDNAIEKASIQLSPNLTPTPECCQPRNARQFIERFQAWIECTAKSFARPQGMQLCDAENFAQETVQQILKKDDDAIQSIKNPRKYLRGIIRNLRSQMLRNTQHERIGIPHLELLEDVKRTKEIDIDAQLVWEEFLSNCNQQQRQIVQLVFVEDIDRRKVAALLGMSRTTLARKINEIKRIAMSILM